VCLGLHVGKPTCANRPVQTTLYKPPYTLAAAFN